MGERPNGKPPKAPVLLKGYGDAFLPGAVFSVGGSAAASASFASAAQAAANSPQALAELVAAGVSLSDLPPAQRELAKSYIEEHGLPTLNQAPTLVQPPPPPLPRQSAGTANNQQLQS